MTPRSTRRSVRLVLVPVLLSLFVYGCGPSDVGTIKPGRDGLAANYFPAPGGRPLKKALPSSGSTNQAPARRTIR